MTTKESKAIKAWLQRGWHINKEVEQLDRQRNVAYNAAVSVSSAWGGERVDGGGKNGIQAKMERLTEYTEKVRKRTEELCAVKSEILDLINCLESSDLRTLLIARYINFETWEQIAVDMSYSWRHIMRIHAEALERLYDVIECHI